MEFIIRNKNIVAFIFFTLFCIISLSIQTSTFVLSVESIGNAFMTPFQKAYDGLHGGIGKLWAGFTQLNDMKEELRRTQEQLMLYESISESIEEIKNENLRLRKVLNIRERIEYNSIPASIIAKDPDNWFRTIIINRGSDDGIKINMPVVAFIDGGKAVVGKISEVRGSISKIVPLVSSEIRVGIKLNQSRSPGLLHGSASRSNMCVIEYISRAVQVNYGEQVITSAQGGVFPPGLIIGSVVKSEVLESSAYQRIIVKPAIDFNRLEEVFIIIKDPDKELMTIFERSE